MPDQLPSSMLKTRFIASQFILLASLLIVLVFILVNVINPAANKAPDVTFATITGQKIALKELRGNRLSSPSGQLIALAV